MANRCNPYQKAILSKFDQKKLDFLLSIPIVSSLIKNVLKKKLGLSKAKVVVSGAAAMQVSQRNWFRKIGVNITVGYGMTENCAITTQIPGSNFDKPGSVGKAQPNVEVKIDKNTEEILMRGPYVMLGYYNEKKQLIILLKMDGYIQGIKDILMMMVISLLLEE